MTDSGQLDDCRDARRQIYAAVRDPAKFTPRTKAAGRPEAADRWRARAALAAAQPYLVIIAPESDVVEVVERAIEAPGAFRARALRQTGSLEDRFTWTARAVLRALAPHAAVRGPARRPSPMDPKIAAARQGASVGRRRPTSATLMTYALHGLQARPVEVRASIRSARTATIDIEGLSVVGDPTGEELADVRDRLRTRIRQAIASQRYSVPTGALTITVTPETEVGQLPGSGWALPMALVVLALGERLDLGGPYAPDGDHVDLRSVVAVGGLDDHGHVLPCRGILPIAIDAEARSAAALLVGPHVLEEAAAVEDLRLLAAATLADAVRALGELHGPRDDRPAPQPASAPVRAWPPRTDGVEAGVLAELRRAVEARASVLIVGSARSPALSLAETVYDLMPPMTTEERRRTTVIHSVHALHAGPLRSVRPLVRATADTPSGVLLGRRELVPREGLVMIADGGVLLLEGLGHFRNDAAVAHLLAAVAAGRQLARTAGGAARIYPAAAQLVATATPCRCGRAPGPDCRCESEELSAYRARLDRYAERFGLVVEIDGFDGQDPAPEAA